MSDADRDRAIAEIPASCMCTWELGLGTAHWQRITPKADCPWHTWEDPLRKMVPWAPERMF